MEDDRSTPADWRLQDLPKRRRVWAQGVAVSAFALRIRLETIRERGTGARCCQAAYDGYVCFWTTRGQRRSKTTPSRPDGAIGGEAR
jgi:hypothetical protein